MTTVFNKSETGHKGQSHRGWLIHGPAALLVVGVVAMTVFAHGNKPHPAATADSTSVRAEAAPAVKADWDPVYGAIQQGFLAVRPIFEKGCFDCHSTDTHYPWYHRLPIVKGEIDSDIRQARKHVDMTHGFPFKGHGAPADDLDAIRDEITSGDMPPLGYRLFHWDAKPTRAEADSIHAWIERSLALLAAHGQYPGGGPHEAGDSVGTRGSGSGQ